MPHENIFNKTGYFVIKNDEVLKYYINPDSEQHLDGINRFINDYNIDINNSTSFEASLNLANMDYICFHSDPDSYLITFIPSNIKNIKQIEAFKKIIPMLQSFNKPQGLVCVNEDGSYNIIDDFDWNQPVLQPNVLQKRKTL